MCIRAFERACVWAQRHWTALFESLIGLIGALAAARPRCFTAVRPCCLYFNLFIFGGSETAVLVFFLHADTVLVLGTPVLVRC